VTILALDCAGVSLLGATSRRMGATSELTVPLLASHETQTLPSLGEGGSDRRQQQGGAEEEMILFVHNVVE
jgi:hypothetical protein